MSPGARGCAFVLFLWLPGWSPAAPAEELRGTALRIFDGDSFILRLDSGRDVEVRLAEIDAPEKSQPHADESRAALTALIFKRKLRAQVLDVDPYQRKVVRAYRVDDALDINAEMVERGHAWVYRRWVRDKTLFEREKRAQAQRLGLWALPEAQRTPPWKWRREHPREHRPEHDLEHEKGSALPPAAGVHSPALSRDAGIFARVFAATR
jgi:endonuclease YncB( thermonuclease family)